MSGQARIAATGLLAVVVAAGCGSSSAQKTSAPSRAKAAIPNTLLGSYSTRLKPRDLPANPPPELTDRGTGWKLTIARTGGSDNGPAFTIINPKLGVLESSAFEVRGDRIVLRREECAAAGGEHFYDNEYQFTLAGDALTFKTIRNRCADRIAEVILTSEPWKKTPPASA
jgi:hypothetical protein